MSSTAASAARQEVGDELWRLTVEQYHAMARANILTSGDAVELLEGLLVAKGGDRAVDALPNYVEGSEEFEPLWRLSVAQYHAMIRAGVLTEDDPVELLEGLLVRTMPRGSAHRRARRLLLKALAPIMPKGWEVDCQDPITTTDSEPEPDILVFRTRDDDYGDDLPGPQDSAIVAEIADSSLRRDRTLKKRLYARSGVREYWIVNLVDRQIEVYTDPAGPVKKPDYRKRQEYKPGESVPVTVDGREVGRLPVADLLP